MSSPLTFFLVVFALSVPFWLLENLTPIQLSPDLPISALIFVVPVTAAAILVYTTNGRVGLAAWLRRAVDYDRIRRKRWYALIVALPLGIYALTFLVMRLVELPLRTAGLRVLQVWMYSNTGKSVFAVALVHAMGNLGNIGPFLDVGPGGYPYSAQRIGALIITALAVMVTVACGPRTLGSNRP